MFVKQQRYLVIVERKAKKGERWLEELRLLSKVQEKSETSTFANSS